MSFQSLNQGWTYIFFQSLNQGWTYICPSSSLTRDDGHVCPSSPLTRDGHICPSSPVRVKCFIGWNTFISPFSGCSLRIYFVIKTIYNFIFIRLLFIYCFLLNNVIPVLSFSIFLFMSTREIINI